jgi:hypothetical protein
MKLTLTDETVTVTLMHLHIGETVVLGASGGTAVTVVGETPTGAVNGSNATFTSLFAFAPETVEVFISGFRLTLLADYNTSGNRTITLFASPITGELVRINYIKQ